MHRLDAFERVLSVPPADIEFLLHGYLPVPWDEFFLNPRRLRGSDFLMRWSQGVWSEERIQRAVNETGRYFALPYGPSGVAPDEPRAFELYFERLEAAGLGSVKRPDFLLFKQSDRPMVEALVARIGGVGELPFVPEAQLAELLDLAILAVESENSLWIASRMPGYGSHLTTQKRLGNQLGLRKTAVVPTVIIKNEDRGLLISWQQLNGVPVHVWHLFFDLAYGLSLDDAERLISTGQVLPTEQVFQAPGGATQRKALYKFYYHFAYPLAIANQEPDLLADRIIDKNGHILPYVRFHGGGMSLTPEALAVLDRAAGG